MSKRVQLGVFFGGKATEHEVSVISGIQAIRHLNQDKYDIIPIYITKSGDFYTGAILLDIKAYQDLPKLLETATQITFVKELGVMHLYKIPFGLSKKPIASIEVALPITHGHLGENGALQGFFELYELPFVGASIAGSAIGMDKVLTKHMMRALDVPVVEGYDFYKYDWLAHERAILKAIEDTLSYPVIVKPAMGGSSIGVAKAHDQQSLRAAIDAAITMDERILVEAVVINLREINVAVKGMPCQAEVSLLEEPISNSDVLTFQDKYMGEQNKGMVSAKREIPAKVTHAQKEIIETSALKVFKTLGLSGVTRIDYILDDTTGQVYFNEMNTIPGSLAFYLWDKKDIPYEVLLDQLIQDAIRRFKRKAELSYTFNNTLFQLNQLNGIKK